MGETILIVDDEPTQRTLLEGVVRRDGHKTLTAANGEEAIKMITAPEGRDISLVLLDLAMPRASGIDVLNRIRPHHPTLPVIALTAQASISKVVDAMRAGADDFLIKPASAEKLRTAIQGVLARDSMVGEIATLNNSNSGSGGFTDLVGSSPAMAEAQKIAKKASQTNVPILIEGESGVGKEVFARAMHMEGPRADKPFIAVNCGALPHNLVESTLFGHEKGAFTGAVETHIGKFEEASGGTLFLDEIGELPPDSQVKLLRALQEGEIDRVGSRVPVKVDIRLISATNRDMSSLVAQGNFREDLYYRLNVVPLTIPPLRDRVEDIPMLARHFLKQIVAREGGSVRALSDAAVNLLMQYDWPGNIRQLQNAIFRAVILSDSTELEPSDFPILSDAVRSPSPEHRRSTAEPDNRDQQMERSAVDSDRQWLRLIRNDGHIHTLEEVEAELIRAAIHRYGGQMSEVARRLGIGRSTLYRRLADLDLGDDQDYRSAVQ